MKKIFILLTNIVLGAALVMGTSSCSEDFINETKRDAMSKAAVAASMPVRAKNQYPPAMVAETMTATYIVPETARVTIFFILEWCLYGVYLCIALLLSIVRAA